MTATRSVNLPNLLTLGRIVLVPVFALAYLAPEAGTYLLASVLFALAAFTDWLDGYLARRLGQTTRFGAFLDPVADKLIVVTALTLLVGHHANPYMTAAGIIIISREVFISALREWMAEMNRRGMVAVVRLGKVKTLLQMAAIAMLLAQPPDLQLPWVLAGYGLLYVAAIMTLWSMTVYLVAAWPTLAHGLKRRR